MVIRKYNSTQLNEFIYSEEYKNLNVIPITIHRALSHIHNPRVEKEDYILYLAYEEYELVGYRIVMADKIFIGKTSHKVGWYSCVWVNPTKRGKGIAKELVKASLNDWKNNIVLGDPVKESKALYLQTGEFTDKIKISGIRGYLKFNSTEILLKKKPSLKIFKPFLQLADSLLNIPNTLRIDLWKMSLKNYSNDIEYITEIDKETEDFINKNNIDDLSRRNTAELNWMIKYPWIIMSPKKDQYMNKFYFSSQAQQFINLNIKVFNNKELTAFLMFNIRDGHLKIPFIALSIEADINKITGIIYLHLLKYNLSTLTTFNPKISDYISKNRNPFIFTKEIKRQFLFSKQFENSLLTNKLYIQDGEGDTAFT